MPAVRPESTAVSAFGEPFRPRRVFARMDASSPQPAVFLVFVDLHGRILPAFRFASYWARRTGRTVTALLQVGDMGYFPDISRMDKASIRHAKDDPLELGAMDVATRTDIADRVFDDDPHCP